MCCVVLVVCRFSGRQETRIQWQFIEVLSFIVRRHAKQSTSATRSGVSSALSIITTGCSNNKTPTVFVSICATAWTLNPVSATRQSHVHEFSSVLIQTSLVVRLCLPSVLAVLTGNFLNVGQTDRHTHTHRRAACMHGAAIVMSSLDQSVEYRARPVARQASID